MSHMERAMQEFALEVCESNLDALTEYMQLFIKDKRIELESDSQWQLPLSQENMLFGAADRIQSSWRKDFYNSYRGEAHGTRKNPDR